MKTVRLVLFLMIVVESGADLLPIPSDLTKLTEQENEERLQKCGRAHQLPGAPCGDDCWAGKLKVVDGLVDDPTDMFHGAVLISPRHALVSHAILNKTEIRGEKTGVGCAIQEPTLSSHQYHWLVDFPIDSNNGTINEEKHIAQFGRCDKLGPADSIMLIELKYPAPDVPYACLPDKEIYDDIERKKVYTPFNSVEKSGLTYKKFNGTTKKCDKQVTDGDLCWVASGMTHTPNHTFSLPLLLEQDDRTTLVGLIHRFDHDAYKFVFTDLRDFNEILCEYVGICPAIPTTTTTTTTTPKPPPTTVYVPHFLLDEEMQDFEEPYHRKQRVKSGAGGRAWRITVVWIMMILMVS